MCNAKEETQRNETVGLAPSNPAEYEIRQIPSGTVVYISGMPFRLQDPAIVSGHQKNFEVAAVDIIFPKSGTARRYL